MRAFLTGVLFASIVLVFMASTRPPISMARPMPQAEVLILGDCQAWGWTFTGSAAFPRLGPNVQVLALPSMTVDEMRASIGRLHGSKARLVVIHVGAADIVSDASPEDIARGILESITEIHAVAHNARVRVVEVLPRRNPEHNAKVNAVNAILHDLASLEAIFDDGNTWGFTRIVDVDMSTDRMPDGVHLDAEGYALLADQIEDVFRVVNSDGVASH